MTVTHLYNDDQLMLRDTARPFLAEPGVAQRRVLRDRDDRTGFCPELWGRFAELGLTGVMAPESAGGAGLGHVEAGLVLHEIGRNLTASPFSATSVGAVTALRAAQPASQAAWLAQISAGHVVCAIGFDERPRHRPVCVTTTAVPTENGYRLNGAKRFIDAGQGASALIFSARTSGQTEASQGVTLFIAPTTAPGLTLRHERLADGGLIAEAVFDDVELDASAVLGLVGEGTALRSRVLNALRVAVAAELVGLAERAFEITLGYLQDRRQFGAPIGSFQGLQHRAAHLYCELELARASTIRAQQALDEDPDKAGRAASVAKATSGLTANLVVQEAVQMHGGIGMTDEHDIGLFMKRAQVLNALYGDPDFHADLLARDSGF